jgi:hypothetical protein
VGEDTCLSILTGQIWLDPHGPAKHEANKLVKTAAVRGPMPEKAKWMVQLEAAAKRVVTERSKKDWVQAWKKEKTSHLMKHLIQAPGPQVLRYWKGLRKATSSVLIQLCTGRIGLNYYLIYINICQDTRCGCGLGNQNLQHIIMVSSFGRTPHRHVAGSLPEKGPGDGIVQPVSSEAEDSSTSERVYTKNRPTITVSSGGSCDN